MHGSVRLGHHPTDCFLACTMGSMGGGGCKSPNLRRRLKPYNQQLSGRPETAFNAVCRLLYAVCVCLFSCLLRSICLSISVYLPLCLSCLFSVLSLFICLYVCQAVFLSVCLTVLSVCLSYMLCLSIWLPVCLSNCCLFRFLPVLLPVCLSIRPSAVLPRPITCFSVPASSPTALPKTTNKQPINLSPCTFPRLA